MALWDRIAGFFERIAEIPERAALAASDALVGAGEQLGERAGKPAPKSLRDLTPAQRRRARSSLRKQARRQTIEQRRKQREQRKQPPAPEPQPKLYPRLVAGSWGVVLPFNYRDRFTNRTLALAAVADLIEAGVAYTYFALVQYAERRFVLFVAESNTPS